MNYHETRSLPELVGHLAAETSDLVRKEIELARAEAREKMGEAMGGARTLSIGAALGLVALGAIFAAIVMGIALAFEIWVGLSATAANCVGAAIVGLIVGIIALSMLASGRGRLSGDNLRFTRTTSSLERGVRVVKERL